MSLVSMTWPEYLAGCCRIDGHLTRMTLQEADVLLALLLGHPDMFTSGETIVEGVWPNANNQPETARHALPVLFCRLRKFGIVIENRFGFGYRIPREARGRPERIKLAA